MVGKGLAIGAQHSGPVFRPRDAAELFDALLAVFRRQPSPVSVCVSRAIVERGSPVRVASSLLPSAFSPRLKQRRIAKARATAVTKSGSSRCAGVSGGTIGAVFISMAFIRIAEHSSI